MMVLALFARRMALGTVVALAARSQPAALSVVARRTLFATTQLNVPPVKASESTATKTTRKTDDEEATKTPAKRGRPLKNPVEPKATQLKQEKRPRIPPKLKPPKRAPGPYFIFYASYVKSQPKANSVQEAQEMSKRAGEIWRGYSMAEKQPFYDENEVRKTQAKEEREVFFRNTSISELKHLNAIRKVWGKTKVHSTVKSPLPVTPFIMFSNEFRASSDGQAIIDQTSPEKKNYTVRAVIAAANRWKSLSEEEKAPYFERFKKAKEELKAAQPNP